MRCVALFLFALLIFLLFGLCFVFAGMGAATGFLVGPLPVVVTNHHVAASAKQIKMTFRDGRTAKGKVLRLDMHNDLALIGFDKPPEVKARFKITHSDSGEARPGSLRDGLS